MHRTRAQTPKPLPMGLRHFSNFRFPTPKSKFINPRSKVHTTIFEAQKLLDVSEECWEKKEFIWALHHYLRGGARNFSQTSRDFYWRENHNKTKTFLQTKNASVEKCKKTTFFWDSKVDTSWMPISLYRPRSTSIKRSVMPYRSTPSWGTTLHL
jgi:hypothetical protein